MEGGTPCREKCAHLLGWLPLLLVIVLLRLTQYVQQLVIRRVSAIHIAGFSLPVWAHRWPVLACSLHELLTLSTQSIWYQRWHVKDAAQVPSLFPVGANCAVFRAPDALGRLMTKSN